MDQAHCHIPFAKTGFFNQLVLDFLAEHPQLRSFYQYSPVRPDFHEAIKAKQLQPIQRDVLVQALQEQYATLAPVAAVQENIASLLRPETFTVCTAHQPNIFTGYLYFVYKILQTIRLAADLKAAYPGRHFVPVYYMGSEDADLEELGSIFINGKVLTWQTKQSGAVGRMQPEGFEELITQVKDTLGYGQYADELIALLREAYLGHDNIQHATQYLVHALFGRYGLVVLIPDDASLKRLYIPVMREELHQHSSFKLVTATIEALSQHYKVQANPREINLFYLMAGARERIVKEGGSWKVLNSDISFTSTELEAELQAHPERFSPNVILRGLFQETILPNVAFIGGGGEIAYWLELQSLFAHYGVPFPVLLLRNSLLLTNEPAETRRQKLGLSVADLFQDAQVLINRFVQTHTNASLVLKEEYNAIEQLFDQLEAKAQKIDVTLVASAAAERLKAIKSIGKLEHKFLRAEKKKFAWQTEQIRQLKLQLFPLGSLQERKENFMPWYIHQGPALFDTLLAALTPVTDQFIVLRIG
ncbi:bacillithiol biosynthesis cysteine-adding enzyme BshC [Chitinophaga pendula]|uniref:bacillithiol biosynthesis cysteine-adding enzyme BshC n=1 Tax=Chitinophaga TaxID=79328 RepID=UPI0012FE4C61|nr:MULTISPECIES: bacillithiol biosynthesis cysteine-adding enzyme BshC [Chitinophaga]UCJ09976.1 bacillithiol biosynthesis cysteine-adding enzyme BshC [Chitinophaga pendula]